MPGQERSLPAGEGRSDADEHGLADHPSTSAPVRHDVRTQTGLASLSWDPVDGVFVATRGRETWSDARLGDLARTVGMKVPAGVARDLRRDELLHPASNTQIRSAYRSDAARPPHVNERPGASPPAAEVGPWPPSGARLVPSRHGDLAVAWQPEDACFVATSASGRRWSAEHLDDLAIKAGVRIPRAYVEDLQRDAGGPLPTWDPPAAGAADDWAEWQPAPVAVPALLDRLPPGLAHELRPALAAPSQTEPGGVERVEATRRAVRAEWGAWANEAETRGRLIEDLDSVMRGLAWGELLHQAVERLEGLADRYGRQVGLDRAPTMGAHMRATRDGATSSPVDRLRALRSRPGAQPAAVGRT